MRRLPGIAVVLLAVATLATATAAPAAGAAGFVPVGETLTTGSAGTPTLAIAPNGYAIVAWVESSATEVFVRVSLRPPGGSWSAPQSMGASDQSKYSLSVAVGTAGDAAVAWSEFPVFGVTSFVATRPAGAAFGAPESLGLRTSAPAVGVDGGGRVTLLHALNSTMLARDFAPGSPALAAPAATLTASGCNSPSLLAVAPSGDALAAYDCGGATFALRRAGAWTASPPILDRPGGACTRSVFYRPDAVSIDADGHAVGVLLTGIIEYVGGCDISRTDELSLVLPLAGVMTPVGGPPAARGTGPLLGGEGISGAQVVVTPAGIVLAWGETPNTGNGRAKARFFAVDGSGGSATQTVGSTPSWGSVTPSLAVAADGRALLAWLQVDRPGGPVSLLVAERPPGDAFGAPVPIAAGSASDAGPISSGAALAQTGDGMVAWGQGRYPAYAIEVRGYDASAPSLSGVGIPASATVGVPASFGAQASDFWGPVTLRWDFGDGATATGAAPQHAYAAPGSYPVSVVATDAVGLSAPAQRGTVQVAAAPPPAGGAPTLSGVSLRNRAFRVGRAATAVTAASRARGRRRAPPVGTTFRFTLDRAASVTIAFVREAAGKRSGRRCVRPSRRLASARRCTRLVAAGTLTRSARAGANAVAFSGRVGRRALGPDRYRATLTATADGRAGAPRALSFRVVR